MSTGERQMIDVAIGKLVKYGIETGLITEQERIYVTNRLYEILLMNGPEGDTKEEVVAIDELETILDEITEYALNKGIIEENTVTNKDLFTAKVMGVMVRFPSDVSNEFYKHYDNSPKEATDYFYKLSKDSDYIRRYRICKDEKWTADTPYGALDITINLSKPEKDPKEIAAAKNALQNSYPKCMLCMESEGYAGNMKYPARQNHRIIPITIQDRRWGFQYSPYVYYNEHCIVFNGEHVPMKINHDTFCKLFDFVKMFPHYFLGSNADLPIVGGSILSHDHFQGGNYEFPMAKAEIEQEVNIKGYEDVKVGIVKWPMSVIRISHPTSTRLISLADRILEVWQSYTDESAFIYSQTDEELHNTITPIARKRGNNYELDLVLRNNITTKECPLGLYHPHEELHHIKKENIGLIEVMGLAVLPARLKKEMNQLSQMIINKENIRDNIELEKHADWVDEFLPKYQQIDSGNIMDILHNEIGIVFMKVLEDAGVYKRDASGKEAFERFISFI